MYSMRSRAASLNTSRGLNPSSFNSTQRYLWIEKRSYALSSSTARSRSVVSQTVPTAKQKRPPPYTIPIRVSALQTSRSLNPTTFQAAQRFLWIDKPVYISPSFTPPPPAPPPPTGGVITDSTLSGDGVTVPLSVVKLGTAHTIGISATGGTTITEIPAPFDGSANATISGFETTGLDGGSY